MFNNLAGEASVKVFVLKRHEMHWYIAFDDRLTTSAAFDDFSTTLAIPALLKTSSILDDLGSS